MPTISFTVILAGDVWSFNASAYKASLAQQLDGVTSDAISLVVSPASIRVNTTIAAPDDSVRSAALSTLTALATSTAALSVALGVSVERLEAPPAMTSASTSDSTSAVSDPASQGLTTGARDSTTVTALAAAAGLVAVSTLLAGVLMFRRRCRPKRTPIVPVRLSGRLSERLSERLSFRRHSFAAMAGTPSKSLVASPSQAPVTSTPPRRTARCSESPAGEPARVSQGRLPGRPRAHRPHQVWAEVQKLLDALPGAIRSAEVPSDDPRVKQLAQTLSRAIPHLRAFVDFVTRDLSLCGAARRQAIADALFTGFGAITSACRHAEAPPLPASSPTRRFRIRRHPESRWGLSMTRTVEDLEALVHAFEAERYSCVPTTHLTSHAIHVTLDTELEVAAGDAPVLEDVSLRREVGAGGFGRVYEGRWQGVRVAVKKVHNDSGDVLQRRRHALLAEAQVLSKISHLHVVHFYGVACASDGAWLLVTEFVSGGDLRRTLYPREGACTLTTNDKADIATGIAAGLWHLQSKGVVHQDLKPGNVLLTPDRVPKLCDFGLASLGNRLRGGTYAYMAPEQWTKQAKITSKVDTFAFGVLLNELICVQPPWPHLGGKEQIKEAVLREQRPQLASLEQLDGMDADFLDVIALCWQADQARRPSMQVVCEELTTLVDGGERSPPSPRAPATSLAVACVRLGDLSSCSSAEGAAVTVDAAHGAGGREASSVRTSRPGASTESPQPVVALAKRIDERTDDDDGDESMPRCGVDAQASNSAMGAQLPRPYDRVVRQASFGVEHNNGADVEHSACSTTVLSASATTPLSSSAVSEQAAWLEQHMAMAMELDRDCEARI